MPSIRVLPPLVVLLLSASLVNCGGGTPTVPANPLPDLTSLSPQSGRQFGSGLTLGITGTGFMASSTVQVNGVSRTAQFVSSSSLTVALSSGDLSPRAQLALTE